MVVAKRQIVPLGIRVISIIYYISAVVSFGFGLFSFVGSHFLEDVETLGTFAGAFGMTLLVLAVVEFLIARELPDGVNWARRLVLVSALLGAVASVFLIIKDISIENIIGLIVSLLLAYYLLFNKNVRAFFAQKHQGW